MISLTPRLTKYGLWKPGEFFQPRFIRSEPAVSEWGGRIFIIFFESRSLFKHKYEALGVKRSGTTAKRLKVF